MAEKDGDSQRFCFDFASQVQVASTLPEDHAAADALQLVGKEREDYLHSRALKRFIKAVVRRSFREWAQQPPVRSTETRPNTAQLDEIFARANELDEVLDAHRGIITTTADEVARLRADFQDLQAKMDQLSAANQELARQLRTSAY